VLTVASLVIGALISRNGLPGLAQRQQRRTTQGVVLAYLGISLLLTLATPKLIVTIMNAACLGDGQFCSAC